MKNWKPFVAVVVLLFCSTVPAAAAIRLGSPFGEHMVLPQGVSVPIWGTGAPGGDTVRVTMAGQSVTAKSDWEGRWMVVLAPMKAGGPFQMLVQVGGYGPLIPSSAANVRGGLELNDVVVGEVRIARRSPGAAIASAADSGKAETTVVPSAWIRVFRIPPRRMGESQSADAGRWTVALPGTAGNYFGASYAFAHELHDRLGVPIGIIEISPGP